MLIIWEMECRHFKDTYRVQKVIKENFQLRSTCMEEASSLAKKARGKSVCAKMSRKGFLVFSSEYPLYHETLLPQSYSKDLTTGMRSWWSSIDSYDGDRTRIYMTRTRQRQVCSIYLAAMLESPELADGVVM